MKLSEPDSAKPSFNLNRTDEIFHRLPRRRLAPVSHGRGNGRRSWNIILARCIFPSRHGTDLWARIFHPSSRERPRLIVIIPHSARANDIVRRHVKMSTMVCCPCSSERMRGDVRQSDEQRVVLREAYAVCMYVIKKINVLRSCFESRFWPPSLSES